MAKHLVSLALVAAALAAGCNSSPSAEPPAKLQPLELKTFARKWGLDTDAKNGPVKEIFVREEGIFVYTANATSYMITRDTGQIMHIETVAGGLEHLHAPVVMKDLIVYPTLTSMEIYDRKSGLFNRSAHLPFAVRSGAVGHKTSVFLGADYPGGGRAVALDLNQQYVPMRWELMFPHAAVSSTPAYFGEAVFAAAEDGSVAAVAVDSREPIWSLPNGIFRAGGGVLADLQVDEVGLYVASLEGRLYCLNRNTGKVKWEFFTNAPLRAAPAVTKDMVFEYVPSMGLVAIDKIAGVDKSKPPQYIRQPRWVDASATQFLAEDDVHVYVRHADNSIVALDKVTGKPAFASKRKDFVAFGTNTKDGIIFAATARGRVMAIQPVSKPGGIGEMVYNDRSEMDPSRHGGTEANSTAAPVTTTSFQGLGRELGSATVSPSLTSRWARSLLTTESTDTETTY